MNKIIIAALISAFAGSAYSAEAYNCGSKRACDFMWEAAQDNAEAVSQMKIRLLTDTRIETYTNREYGYSAVITKRSTGADSAMILARCEGNYRPDTTAICERSLENRMQAAQDYTTAVDEAMAAHIARTQAQK